LIRYNTNNRTYSTIKNVKAAKYNVLVVNRCVKYAVIGIIIPFTNINIDVSHYTVLLVKCISFIILGKAVVMSV